MGKGKQTQTTQSAPWAPAQGYLKDALGQASDLYNGGNLGIDYSGDWVADMTGGQQDALRGIIGQAGQNTGVLQGLLGSLGGIADGSTQGQNWDTIANDTITRLMPGINSSFAGSGMTGSTLHQQNLSKGLSEGLATAKVGHDNNAIQQQMAATSGMGGLLQQIMGNSQTVYDAESQFQDQAQRELDSQYQNGLLQQDADWDAFSKYLSAITGIGGMGGTQTTTQQKQGGLLGAIGGIAGGLSGVGSIAKSLSGLAALSDRRLKQNIKRVGQTDTGLGIYTYSYLGSDRIHMGVMADEVQAILPEAVEPVGDYLAVNYGRL